MATLFTRIINRELPGEIVYEDDDCVAFLTIEPLRDGHLLVVPRAEVDHWLDLEPQLLSQLVLASQRIGRALHREFGSEKVGMMLVGLEVPHTHVHLMPIDAMSDMDFSRTRPAQPDELAAVAARVRRAIEQTPS